MYGQGILNGLKITIRHFFGRAITEQYPETRHDLPERSRNFFDWSEINCTACLACERACPNEVIVIASHKDPESRKRIVTSFKMYLEYCLFCGLCIEACPYNALHFTPQYELASYSRSDTNYEMVSSAEFVEPPSEELRVHDASPLQ